MSRDRHVVPRPASRWAVTKGGSVRASAVCLTKEEAIRRATEIVQRLGGSRVFVHGRFTGKIERVIDV